MPIIRMSLFIINMCMIIHLSNGWLQCTDIIHNIYIKYNFHLLPIFNTRTPWQSNRALYAYDYFAEQFY